MASVEFELADHKQEQRPFVCSENLPKHKGNAVTIMGKMKARNGENAIIIWDGTGDVNLTANDEEFFMFVMENSYVVAEGYATADNEVDIREITELEDANDDTLKLRAKTALLMDKWSGAIYGQ